MKVKHLKYQFLKIIMNKHVGALVCFIEIIYASKNKPH